MLISIIIPTFNGEKYLAATVDSVLAQSVADWELLIVDDGSQDATLSIAEEYVRRDSRIRLLSSCSRNVAAARNSGFQSAQACSSYIAFLDHDDVWEPHTLETLLTMLRVYPNAVSAHGLAHYVDGQGQAQTGEEAETWTRNRQAVVDERLVELPAEWPTTFASLAYANNILTPGQVLIRRQALEQVGLLDMHAVPSDDYDLWLRLCQFGDIAFVNKVVIGFRQHAANASHQKKRLEASEHYVRAKMLSTFDLEPGQRRMIARGWRWWRRHLMAQRFEWTKRELQQRSWLKAFKQIRHALAESLALSRQLISYGRNKN